METVAMIQELGKRIEQLMLVTSVDKQWEGELHRLYVARAALLDLAGVEA